MANELGKLAEVGTRYEHWQELRDLFLTGVEAVSRMSPYFRSDADIVKSRHLQIAADLIARQIEAAGNHEQVRWTTERQIRGIPKHVTPKDEGSTEEDR